MKIHSVRADWSHADTTKLIAVFCNFANAPINAAYDIECIYQTL